MTLLAALLVVPILGAIVVALGSRLNGHTSRIITLITMGVEVALSLAVLVQTKAGPIIAAKPWIPAFGASFLLEVDGLSAVLIVLTAVLGLVAVVAAWNEIVHRTAAFHIWLLLLLEGVLIVFSARDLILFYFGYELMLIPAFFLIGLWGRDQMSNAALKFLLFTFAGSIFILASFLYVYVLHGAQTGVYSFALADLVRTNLSTTEQVWVFLGFLLGFGVKVPLVPLHSWQPDAYGQAPSAVTLLLAGVVSKTGAYGLLRFAFPMAPEGLAAWSLLIQVLAIVGIIYGAIVAFGQRDFKRLIAYSSLSHLGFIVLGLTVGNRAAIEGAILQMVMHGLATGALFMIAGALQARTATLSLDQFGGFWRQMPALGAFLLFFVFASLGLPGTGNFVGELYIVGGVFVANPFLGALAAIGVLLGAIYSLKLYIWTMQGPEAPVAKRGLYDATPGETVVLGSLAAIVVAIGFFPSLITGPLFYPPNLLVPADTPPVPTVVVPAAAEVPASHKKITYITEPAEHEEVAQAMVPGPVTEVHQ